MKPTDLFVQQRLRTDCKRESAGPILDAFCEWTFPEEHCTTHCRECRNFWTKVVVGRGADAVARSMRPASMRRQEGVHTNRSASVRLCVVMDEFTAQSTVINGGPPAPSFNLGSPHEGTRGGSDVLAKRGEREVGSGCEHVGRRRWGRLTGRFRCSCALASRAAMARFYEVAKCAWCRLRASSGVRSPGEPRTF